jgi:alkylhydroperoxidase family enzyme
VRLPQLEFAQLDARLQEYLRPTVERLGYLGEFFQVVGHVPGALIEFMEYTKAVKAPLTDAENEVLALSVCSFLGADYERIQHERLARRLGFSLDWIAAAMGRSDAGALKPEERALRDLALGVSRRGGKECTAEIAAVARLLGPEKTMAVLLQITRFGMIAALCNALNLRLPVKSVFEEASD